MAFGVCVLNVRTSMACISLTTPACSGLSATEWYSSAWSWPLGCSWCAYSSWLPSARSIKRQCRERTCKRSTASVPAPPTHAGRTRDGRACAARARGRPHRAAVAPVAIRAGLARRCGRLRDERQKALPIEARAWRQPRHVDERREDVQQLDDADNSAVAVGVARSGGGKAKCGCETMSGTRSVPSKRECLLHCSAPDRSEHAGDRLGREAAGWCPDERDMRVAGDGTVQLVRARRQCGRRSEGGGWISREGGGAQQGFLPAKCD